MSLAVVVFGIVTGWSAVICVATFAFLCVLAVWDCRRTFEPQGNPDHRRVLESKLSNSIAEHRRRGFAIRGSGNTVRAFMRGRHHGRAQGLEEALRLLRDGGAG